jgi:phosphoribosyl-ATP pyrophosphohydrolase/phosphoribosyl-AMP cyclohydrolase
MVDGESAGLRFDANGLIPAIAQDAESGQVLMLAYMNREALARTRATGFAHYFSRSRQRLWKKGEASGHVQRVREIRYDCDGDALLLAVDQTDAACHTGERSCFYRPLRAETPEGPAPPAGGGDRSATADLRLLDEVFQVILQRKARAPEGSYVAALFRQGEGQILKKILEESAEVLLASRDADRRQIVYEVADLWFHTLVLLAHHGIEPGEIAGELSRRMGKRKGEYPEGGSETDALDDANAGEAKRS